MDYLLRRLALAIGLACGLVATQAPEFAQQYRQRLAGAIDELSRIVQQFETEAASQSLTPAEAIARLEANSDELARERGADIDSDMVRLTRLQAELAAFRDAAPLRRLATLARQFDPKTAELAWQDFEPAMPTSFEALVLGGLAAVWGWATTHLCIWPVRRHWQRRRQRLARS